MSFFKTAIPGAVLCLGLFSCRCAAASYSVLTGSSVPEPSLRHLEELTDDTGIFEHATYDIPNKKHAYCTEDNARALVAVLMFNRIYSGQPDDDAAELARIYMSYLLYAQQDDGNFSHRLDFQRNSHDLATEDSYGRAIWGLGYASAPPSHEGMGALAQNIVLKALPRATTL